MKRITFVFMGVLAIATLVMLTQKETNEDALKVATADINNNLNSSIK